MIRHTKKIVLFIATSLVVFACSDFLEVRPTSQFTEEEVFSSIEKSQQFINSIYRGIPDRPNFGLEYYTDNAVRKDKSFAQNFGYSAESSPVEGVWANSIKYIISINEYLEKGFSVVYDVYDSTYSADLKQRFRGEAFGLRAWYQWQLLKNFAGPSVANTEEILGFPILDGVVTQEEANAISRSSYLDCFNRINQDIDSALVYIKIRRYTGQNLITGITNVGRISQEMLLALRARVYLYAASPAYEIITWETAADMIYASFDSIDGGFYDPYKLKPYGNFNNTENPDDFWRSRFNTDSDIERNNYPPSLFGNGICNPSQNLVESFPNYQGYPIDNIFSFYDPNNPYVNRDLRLERFVFYNGKNDFRSANITTYTGGYDAPGGLQNMATRSGYYMKKYMSENIDITPNSTNKSSDTKFYAFFTRQGLYLDLAEAAVMAYGLTGQGADWKASGIDLVRAIRVRGGIPETEYYFDTEAMSDVNKMIDLIRNERRIEFAFEGERFYDVRRWKLPVEELNEPVYGVDITYINDTTFTYENKVIENRYFDEKMYYNPIPREEILKSSSLVQNAGW